MSVEDRDRGWNRIRRELKLMAGSVVKIGVISGGGQERYEKHAGVPGEGQGSDINIAELATAHEFGVGNIPERPFMRQAFDTNHEEVSRRIRSLRDQIYNGRIDTKMALNELGVFHKGHVQEIFVKGGFKPLAPATVRKKGSSRPLIDTGRLRQSIDFEVVLKNG